MLFRSDEANRAGRIKKDDIVIFVAFGAGLTWGALSLRWVEPERVVKTIHLGRKRLVLLVGRVRSRRVR